MSFTSSYTFPDVSLTNEVRRTFNAVRDNITALGLINVFASGSGAYNPNTVTGSAATNAIFGYDVFRFNDALQGTNPVFIRLEYRSRSNAPSLRPAIRFRVGTTHDGSGNLGGQLGTDYTLEDTANAIALSGSLLTNYFSGDTNRLVLAFGAGQNDPIGAHYIVSVERSRNNNGTDSTEGILTTVYSNQLAWRTQYIPYSGSIPTNETRLSGIIRVNGSTAEPSIFNGLYSLSPVYCFNGRPENPGLNLVIGSIQDNNNGSLINYSYYPGTTARYLSLDTAKIGQAWYGTTNLIRVYIRAD